MRSQIFGAPRLNSSTNLKADTDRVEYQKDDQQDSKSLHFMNTNTQKFENKKFDLKKNLSNKILTNAFYANKESPKLQFNIAKEPEDNQDQKTQN